MIFILLLQGKRKSHKNFRWSYILTSKLPSLSEKRTTRRLTNSDAKEVQRLLSSMQIVELSKKFNVSADVIRDIKHNRGAYKNIWK